MEREPCPWRILDDAGGAFVFGVVGGGIWNFVGGARNAPRQKMLSEAINRCKARAPILGGSFAVWGTFFSIFDCSIAAVRQKEDPWNAIMSGAATGGLLAIRAGFKASAKSAAIGGVILAAIEGFNIVLQRVILPSFDQSNSPTMAKQVDSLEPPTDPLASQTFGRKSGGKLWETSPSVIDPAASAGFDLDNIYKFDDKDNWNKKSEQGSSSSESPSTSTSSWWKPW